MNIRIFDLDGNENLCLSILQTVRRSDTYVITGWWIFHKSIAMCVYIGTYILYYYYIIYVPISFNRSEFWLFARFDSSRIIAHHAPEKKWNCTADGPARMTWKIHISRILQYYNIAIVSFVYFFFLAKITPVNILHA